MKAGEVYEMRPLRTISDAWRRAIPIVPEGATMNELRAAPLPANHSREVTGGLRESGPA